MQDALRMCRRTLAGVSCGQAADSRGRWIRSLLVPARETATSVAAADLGSWRPASR